MNTRLLAKRLLLVVALLVVAVIIQHVVLKGAFPVKMKPAPSLAASISPSLVSDTSGSKSLPVAGKDFKILSTAYFDNQQWAVVSVSGGNNNNTGFLVVEKIGGVYTVVLGPGTSFPPDVSQSMPGDVSQYLVKKGLIH